jgi:two-component system, chemotaxis family, sensor kinase CheA
MASGDRAGPRPPPANPLAQDPELVHDFILESKEHLASIESRMLILERNPADREALNSVFRGFHTIKALAAFPQLAVIEQVAHEVETVLDLVRSSKLAITPTVVDLVLGSADFLKAALAAAEAAPANRTDEPAGDHSALLSKIQKLVAEALGERERRPEEPSPKPPAAPKPAETFSVRLEIRKLDHLVDMVGELVVAQSLLLQNPKLASIWDSRLQGDLAHLAFITGEVQRATIGMRVVRIGQLFYRTARLVRDLTRKAGKQVELDISGEEIEVDKTIIEELADPLMHMVRNAIDHGVETAEDRAAAGKNPNATVRLGAYPQGGQMVVEISDDGRGLDREKILAKAQQLGLAPEGAQLSESEIFQLIFEPGLSTADQVSDVSGRGVGMDVVRQQVQKLGGRIEIRSRAGQGATFLLRLPLMLSTPSR